jgi:hypothetical protein
MTFLQFLAVCQLTIAGCFILVVGLGDLDPLSRLLTGWIAMVLIALAIYGWTRKGAL